MERAYSIFPGRNRTAKSLKCKFQEMARAKIPTGESECPRHIHIANRAYYSIVNSLTAMDADLRPLFLGLRKCVIPSRIFVLKAS